MAYDFNAAGEQRTNELIPDGTIATVHLTVRPGNAGEGGWLKRSKNGESEALDCEFTVVDGPFAKRKFWSLNTMNGTTDGHAKAADISASRIRAMLESARGIRPDDEGDAAKTQRRINTFGDLNGLRFIAKIGIEQGKDGYKDKNTLAEVITPDRKAWAKVEQVVTTAAPTPAATIATNKPAWAA
jgi:hypothetical protein